MWAVGMVWLEEKAGQGVGRSPGRRASTMGMTLEREPAPEAAAGAESQQSLVIRCEEASTDTSDAPQWSPSRRGGVTFTHTLFRTIKGLMLTLELAVALLLAGYSGLLTLLPATPPTAHVRSASAAITARPDFYCWLTPGRGTCTDNTMGSSSRVPAMTAARGSTIEVSVASPAPTSCVATATNPDDDAAPPVPLRAVPDRAAAAAPTGVSYRVAISLSPGQYLLMLTCAWNGRPDFRWLDGQGAATYSVALQVTK
jgi:hypothetical protein